MTVFIKRGAGNRINLTAVLDGADRRQGIIGQDAITDMPFSMADKLINPGNLTRQGPRPDYSHDPGYMDGKMGLAGLLVRKPERREPCGGILSLPHGFDGGQ